MHATKAGVGWSHGLLLRLFYNWIEKKIQADTEIKYKKNKAEYESLSRTNVCSLPGWTALKNRQKKPDMNTLIKGLYLIISDTLETQGEKKRKINKILPLPLPVPLSLGLINTTVLNNAIRISVDHILHPPQPNPAQPLVCVCEHFHSQLLSTALSLASEKP